MKHFFTRISFSLSLLFILSPTLIRAQEAATPTATVTNEVSLSTLVDGNNVFGFELYHKLAPLTASDKNLVYSPYSVCNALGMAWVGARHNTKTQMTQLLSFVYDDKIESGAFHRLRDGLEAAGKAGGFDLSIVNSLWLQNGGHFEQPFMDTLNNDFNAPPRMVDFSNPEAVRSNINDWVADKTNKKIMNLISAGALKGSKMVLVNAVYFKADWLNPFKAETTTMAPFHFPHADASVSMMNQTHYFPIAQNDEAQILQMPYQGGQLSMVVILPTDWKLAAFEKKLTTEMLDAWLADMKTQLVAVKLPKFKFSYGTTDLTESLVAMGMTDAFSKNADFSGITGDKSLLISHVLHKAYVNVDEKGTEAAAATAVGIAMKAVRSNPEQPIRFTADHPFIFLIRDNLTKSILFIGRVADPRNE